MEKKKPEEDGLRQVRNNYFLIVAVILSLILSPKPVNKNKFPMFLVLLSLISLMYALDVHLKDQYNRQDSCYNVIVCDVQDRINSGSINTTWYNYDYSKLSEQWDKAAKTPDRWWRKLRMAFTPDGEQIVYFFIPWIVLYIFTAKEILKNTT